MKAWLKLQVLCHAGDTEIGAFAITSAQNPLYVTDLITVPQTNTSASVEFDDEAVADFVDEQVEHGRQPEQFLRIWVHTHPGDCPNPSGTDEETFDRVFGECNWAVMFILAKGGAMYCRLRVNAASSTNQRQAKLSLATVIDCEVDHGSVADDLADLPVDQWMREYHENVTEEARLTSDVTWPEGLLHDDLLGFHDEDDFLDELLELDDSALRQLMQAMEDDAAECQHAEDQHAT